MKLLHYSEQLLTGIHDCKQYPDLFYWKPTGLWMSVQGEHDWKAYCEDTQFAVNELHSYVITLKEDAQILYIMNSEQLVDFHQTFANEDEISINWLKVSQSYDGIIISPYQRGIRWNLIWYAMWDCASGCIWNSRAVQNFTIETS